MTTQFNFQMLTRVVWSTPVRETLPVEVSALGGSRVLIVTDPGVLATGLVDGLVGSLRAAGTEVVVHADVSGNPTTDDVVAARTLAVDSEADVIVAFGGGSAMDTAKACAMLLANGGDYSDYQWDGRPITERSHPFIAIPTTAGTGSEVSKVAVITDANRPFKKGVLSPLMFAHVALIDPEVTFGLPSQLTAATGIDAFIHALEAYIGNGANPISDVFALESLRLAWRSLERATRDGSDLEAREDMMLAAITGGIAMDQAGLGLVHAISGGLCSHLHLHHGLANAMILPFVAEFNASAIQADRLRVLSQILGLADAEPETVTEALTMFVDALGLPIGLADRRDETKDLDWEAVAEESMRMVMIHNNPRPVAIDDCRRILAAMK